MTASRSSSITTTTRSNRLQQDSRNDNLDSTGQPVITQHFVEADDYSPATNRFTSGVTYDAAGNVTTDSRFRLRQFLYDANNRQRQSSNLDGSNPVVSVYDGVGQRVATKAGGVLTNVMVYDAGGKLVAEYAQSVSAAGTQYVMGDHQGSTRVVMNATGVNGGIVSRHDYLPFGEDVPSNVGMRSTAQGYAQADGVRQKYAGMESDEATGMSHTLWREFDNRSARWTSPDPYGGSMDASSPQSFNRYAYVNNDPVNKVDPTGLMLSDIGVVQTNDAGYAHTLQGASDAAWKKSINEDYARRHDLVIDEEQVEGGTRHSARPRTYNTSVNVVEEGAISQSPTESQLGIVAGPIMATQSEDELRQLNNSSCVGKTCDCVPLVKALTGTTDVHTSRYREGEHVFNNTTIQPGTAIATFFNGRYPSWPSGNHAAIFLGHVAPSRQYPLGGIEVLDQYANKDKISIRIIPTLKHDGDAVNNARRFSIIYIAPPPAERKRR